MSEINTSFAEPAYIARLALKRAPFTDDIDSQLYFSGGQLENRLNLLLHLVRSSDKNGVVIAEKGSGKTTLLTELRSRAGDELRICTLNGQQQTDRQTSLSHCLLELGVEQAELNAASNLSELFRSRLIQLKKLHLSPLILIDDAQSLSDELLHAISTWLGWQDNGQFLLQAIFFSSKELSLPEQVLIRTQAIDLPVLNEKEMAHYLTERLQKAGYIGESLFNKKLLKRLYKTSSGNPQKLNHLVHLHLLGQKSPPGLAMFSLFKISFKWLGMLLLVAIIAAALINQDRINQFFTPLVTNESSNEIIKIKGEEQLANVVVEPTVIQSNEQANRNELTSLLAEIERTPNKKQKPPTMVAIPRAKDSAATQEAVGGSDYEFFDETWIKRQVGTHYTFQLMGSWKKQDVYDFVEKYALSGDVALFESKRNNRVWYALIYGVFDTKEAALAASNKWPAPLNTLPSWLRRFDSIQKQIKSKS